MKKDIASLNMSLIFLLLSFVLFFTTFLQSGIHQSSQTDSKSENKLKSEPSTKEIEKARPSEETEQAVDKEKIVKDITGMTSKQVIKYAIDQKVIYKKSWSAIYALEYAIKSRKESIKEINYMYSILGGYYASLGKIDKSVDNYSIYFKNKNYPDGIPETPEGIRKYKYDENYYILMELISEINKKEVWNYMVKLSEKIIEEENYSKASQEAIILADKILKREEKLIAEEKLKQQRMKIFQEFLDELAPIIEKRDADAVFKLFREHTTTDKKAQIKAELIDKYFWQNDIKKVSFEVTDYGCIMNSDDCYIYYIYTTEPDLYELVKKEFPQRKWGYSVFFTSSSFYFQ